MPISFCDECEVAYEGRIGGCPVCLANESIEELKQEVERLENELTEEREKE